MIKLRNTAHSASLGLALTLATAGGAAADVVFNDDVIVIGSLCVGFDCVNGEAFNFATLRLKENNTRIDFVDTSGAGFATRDWRIEANSSAGGGASYLALKDMGNSSTGAEGGTALLRLSATAPANSIFVASTGNVGFRTASPVLDLHVADSDTPAMRLQQTGAGGFSPQVWDIAGNEANFFVRDVTGGSRLPLRIRPGAPTSSLDIAATGRVGLNRVGPLAPLHVAASAGSLGTGNVVGLFTNPAGLAALQLVPNGVDPGATPNWTVAAVNDTVFRINRNGVSPAVFRLNSNGNLTITGTLTSGGPTCGGGCDAVFDPEADIPSIADHAAEMWSLGYLPNVGPTPEGEPINITEKLGRMLNELEKAHIYIAELEARLARIEAAAE